METIEQAVQQALAQHLEWSRVANPSSRKHALRVIVQDGSARVLRRPICRSGQYFVQWNGLAQLTNPHKEDDDIVFTASWSW